MYPVVKASDSIGDGAVDRRRSVRKSGARTGPGFGRENLFAFISSAYYARSEVPERALRPTTENV
jgi:hypothetical protein